MNCSRYDLDMYRCLGSRKRFIWLSSNVLAQCVGVLPSLAEEPRMPRCATWFSSHSPRLNPTIQWLKTQASAQTSRKKSHQASQLNSHVARGSCANIRVAKNAIGLHFWRLSFGWCWVNHGAHVEDSGNLWKYHDGGGPTMVMQQMDSQLKYQARTRLDIEKKRNEK